MKRIPLIALVLFALAGIASGQIGSQRVVWTSGNPPTVCVPGKVYTNPSLNPAKSWVGTSTSACTPVSTGTSAPVDATYITQTANATLTNEQALASLATGIVKNTTTTGVLSIAAAGTDYQSPITFGTGVQTALGVNIGSAGAPVLFNGALGSPSSVGTLPAHTLGGTVSGGGNQINNVIIGASTPLAGTFTGVVGTSVTDSGLTAARVTFAGTGGLLADDADMTFATDTLTVTKLIVGGGSALTSTGAGGALGTNAFTSTAYAPLASPTFTGTVAFPTSVTVNGNAMTFPTTAQTLPGMNQTNTAGSSYVLDASAASVTAGLKIPSAAGAVPTADGFIATNTTNHTHVWGSNGTTMVGAIAATGTGTATTCSNQFVSAVSSLAVPTCTTVTLAGAQFANQGTTTTVLHGNAAGNPSFGQVSISADVSGLGTGVGTWLATPSSANLASAITDETGSGVLAFATTPTFTTNITVPLVIGSTAVGGNAEVRSTSGVGTTDFIKFTVGNSGATEAGRFTHSGGLSVGATSDVAAGTINANVGFTVAAAATSRKMLVGDGTKFLASTETWAVPGTSGNVLTSDGTNWTSAVATASTPDRVRAYNSANETISTATETTLTFNTESYDNNSMHSTSSNTGNLVATQAGLYEVCGHGYWASTPVAGEARIYVNSTLIADASTPASLGFTICTQWQASAADIFQFRVNHTTGVSVDIVASGVFTPAFMATRVGP